MSRHNSWAASQLVKNSFTYSRPSTAQTQLHLKISCKFSALSTSSGSLLFHNIKGGKALFSVVVALPLISRVAERWSNFIIFFYVTIMFLRILIFSGIVSLGSKFLRRQASTVPVPVSSLREKFTMQGFHEDAAYSTMELTSLLYKAA